MEAPSFEGLPLLGALLSGGCDSDDVVVGLALGDVACWWARYAHRTYDRYARTPLRQVVVFSLARLTPARRMDDNTFGWHWRGVGLTVIYLGFTFRADTTDVNHHAALVVECRGHESIGQCCWHRTDPFDWSLFVREASELTTVACR